MAQAFIALGANLGEPEKALLEAVKRIGEEDGIALKKCSSFYKTEPIDSSGPDYVNAVLEVQTALTPEDLLKKLLEIELEFGRERPMGIHNAPRTMDLDLLLYEGEIRSEAFLTLPHPRMHERAFVLVPLCEIAPEVQIPGKGLARNFLPSIQGQGIQRIEQEKENSKKWKNPLTRFGTSV